MYLQYFDFIVHRNESALFRNSILYEHFKNEEENDSIIIMYVTAFSTLHQSDVYF